MQDKLAHLSVQQIAEFRKRYYAGGERLSKLAEDFGIRDVPAQKLFEVLPPEIHADRKCVCCNGSLITIARHRNKQHLMHAECLECGHTEVAFCGCGV